MATKARTSYYRISIDELKQIATNRKWIHENDIDDTDKVDKSDDMITIPQEEYNNPLKRIKELEEQLEVNNYEDDIFEENIDSIINSIESSYLDSIITEEASEYELEEEPNEIYEDNKEKVDDDVDEDYEKGCNDAYDLINTL